MRYEAPLLGKVGKADTVILGITDSGNDIDGQYWMPELEFMEDQESEAKRPNA